MMSKALYMISDYQTSLHFNSFYRIVILFYQKKINSFLFETQIISQL